MRVHPLGKYLLLLAALGLFVVFSSCSDNPAKSSGPPFPEIDPTNTENQADYLMIAPEALIDGLPDLASHREDQGLSLAIVTLEQIADSFPEAHSVEEGIRSFIAYAYGNWQEPKPGFVLLVGDTDLIPTHFFESSLGAYGEEQVAIDDLYATVEGDDDELPDLALGRFPVSNLEELATAINKTLAFEQPGGGIYETDGLIVSDYLENDPLGLSFESMSDNFAAQFPGGATVQRLALRQDSPNFGTREDLFAALQTGLRILTYTGHGNVAAWSNSGFLTVTSLPELPTIGTPSFIVALTSSQNFHDFGEDTLIRELLLLKSGGSAASVAPSGVISLYAGFAFYSSFWEELWKSPDQTVGMALLAAKRKQGAGLDGDFQSQPSRYTLLGDPALRLGSLEAN
jgi:hypothetical protein